MKQGRIGTRARVLAAALRTWTTLRSGPSSETAVRVDVRQPTDWGHVGTIDLDPGQAGRVLAFLRDDVARTGPAATVAAHVDGWLTEQAAAGRRRIHAADLLDVVSRAGRPKQEMAAHLTHLVDTGRLRETWRPGVYRLTPRPTSWAVRRGMPAARPR